MSSESLLNRNAAPGARKGPGTNKAELETLFWGVDSDRADTAQAHIEAGVDLATIAGFVAAAGLGGFVAAPAINTNTDLNDTTYTELGATRFTCRGTSGLSLIQADLIFDADAAGVDLGDIRVGTAAGAHASLGWLVYPDASGNRVTDVVSNVFTHNPHSIVADIPNGESIYVQMTWLVTNVSNNDFWIEAKSDDDTSGTTRYRGGVVRAYDVYSPIFTGASEAP